MFLHGAIAADLTLSRSQFFYQFNKKFLKLHIKICMVSSLKKCLQFHSVLRD